MLYVSTSSIINNKDLFNVLEKYNKLNIKNIELGSVHNYISDFSKLFKFQKDNDINFIIHCFFPPNKKPFFINLTSQNKKNIKKAINFSKNAIEMCRKLNSKLYTTHPGFNTEVADEMINNSLPSLSKKYNDDVLFDTLKKSVTEICDYASNYDIKFAIETMDTTDPVIMTNASIFLKFLKNIKLKNLGILFDTGHMKVNSFLLNFDLKESVEKLKKYIIALHLHDNSGKGKDEHLPIKNTTILDCFGKIFLRDKYITSEGMNNWTEEDILDSKKLVETYLS